MVDVDQVEPSNCGEEHWTRCGKEMQSGSFDKEWELRPS